MNAPARQWPHHGGVRIGFLGAGWIGRKRLESIAKEPGVELAACHDPDRGALEAVAAAHPHMLPCRSLEELLDCGLDGLVIATPTGLHADQAVAALRAGVAVFCQKPLATNLADTARVIEMARRADRLLAVDYCYRRLAGMETLRSRIREGVLGELLWGELLFHNAYAPGSGWAGDRTLAGGGCLVDLGTHLVDLLLWLLDFPRLEVTFSRLYSNGLALEAGSRAIEDLALAQLESANGAVIRLSCSWRAHLGREAHMGLILVGSRAAARWRNLDGSFYDFQVELLQGLHREALGRRPDEWGGRALSAWTAQLAAGGRFDPAAGQLLAGARLIDDMYEQSGKRQ